MKYHGQVIQLGTVAIKVIVLVVAILISILIGMLIQRTQQASESSPETVREESSQGSFVGSYNNQNKKGYTLKELAPGVTGVSKLSQFSATFQAMDPEAQVMEFFIASGDLIPIAYTDTTEITLQPANPITLGPDNLKAEDGLEAQDPKILFPRELKKGDQILVQVAENALLTTELTATRLFVQSEGR